MTTTSIQPEHAVDTFCKYGEKCPFLAIGKCKYKHLLQNITQSDNTNGVNLSTDCSICLEENTTRTALVECGHSVFCFKCASRLFICPICRAKVVKINRIYI